MKELKEYLTPSLYVFAIEEDVFTGKSSEMDMESDPYGNDDENNWWG